MNRKTFPLHLFLFTSTSISRAAFHGLSTIHSHHLYSTLYLLYRIHDRIHNEVYYP